MMTWQEELEFGIKKYLKINLRILRNCNWIDDNDSWNGVVFLFIFRSDTPYFYTIFEVFGCKGALPQAPGVVSADYFFWVWGVKVALAAHLLNDICILILPLATNLVSWWTNWHTKYAGKHQHCQSCAPVRPAHRLIMLQLKFYSQL